MKVIDELSEAEKCVAWCFKEKRLYPILYCTIDCTYLSATRWPLKLFPG